MIRIDYIDNQGVRRSREIQASTIAGAVAIAEFEANENGHGMASIVSAVREGKV